MAKFNRPKPDPRFIEPSNQEILDRLDTIRLFCEEVIGHLKPTPAGDAYEYRGGMNHVEFLKEAVDDYHGLWYRTKKAS